MPIIEAKTPTTQEQKLNSTILLGQKKKSHKAPQQNPLEYLISLSPKGTYKLANQTQKPFLGLKEEKRATPTKTKKKNIRCEQKPMATGPTLLLAYHEDLHKNMKAMITRWGDNKNMIALSYPPSFAQVERNIPLNIVKI